MATPITDIEIEGSSGQIEGTLTVASGGTLSAASGGAVTMASGSTLTISAGATLTLQDASVGWAKVDKTGSSIADLATKSAGDLDSGTLAVARHAALVGDSGAGGTAGIAPAPGAGDAAANKYLKADATWAVVASDFLNLSDVDPSSYSGQTGKFVRVNATEDGLEFVTAAAGVTDFTDLGDVPSSYSGQGTKIVAVNSGETALEFVDSNNGTKTYGVWTAMQGQPPSSNYATIDSRNSIAVLDFDDSTDESVVFVGILPEAANVSSGLIAIVKWAATSATSGNVVWAAQLECEGTDIDSDSFDTAATATGAANGTSGIPTSTSITMSSIDSVTEGKLFRLKIYRDADNGSDTMTGDAELIAVELRSGA